MIKKIFDGFYSDKAFEIFVVIVTLTFIMIFSYGIGWGIGHSFQKQDIYEYSKTMTYTVEPGDSLWTIAQQHSSKKHDTRIVVYEIQEINGINSYIHPYDRIEIPVYNY